MDRAGGVEIVGGGNGGGGAGCAVARAPSGSAGAGTVSWSPWETVRTRAPVAVSSFEDRTSAAREASSRSCARCSASSFSRSRRGTCARRSCRC